MKERCARLIEEASKQFEAERLDSAIALTRILLQHLCISLAEWVVGELRSGNRLSGDQQLDLSELRAPSDGTLAQKVADLLVAAENLGWSGVSRPLWRPITTNRPSLRLASSRPATLEKILAGFINRRNEGVEGHGIPGDSDSEAMLDVASLLLESFKRILPDETANGLVIRSADGKSLPLKILKTFDGDLVCYRSIQPRPNNRCVVRAQRQLSLTSRSDVVWEADDVLSFRLGDRPIYRIHATASQEWCPLALLPDPLTDHFRGRNSEIDELIDWANDRESRACLLFGDGGIGKTTLALEFVHRMLDGSIEVDWKPELITFYTAKQTRWGIDGLEYIRSQTVGVMDIAPEIIRALEGAPAGRSWYDKEPRATIDRLGAYLAEWGVDRRNHLFILDNTETMATNEEEVKRLAQQVRDLSRRVGRILLTSRRREPIEARQIEVPPLHVEDSVALLRSRAEELNRKPILQAGDSTLRQICNRLGNRPLVLEVFVQTLREEQLSLSSAFDRVLRMQRQDLGEFLYDDAWKRFSHRIQVLLLVMTRVSDVHDEALLKLCCQVAEVSVIEAYDALSESRGIAMITRIEGSLQVTFSPDFLRFAEGREIRLGGECLPPESWIQRIKKRYTEFLRSKSAKISDRVSLAYRTPFARAAWQAFQEERFEDCETYYELAVVEDRENGLLFDRYAYFLFYVKRHDEALGKSQEATRLASQDPETWFTRGLIEARLGLCDEAEQSLMKARSLGKEEHLCYLQIAYGFANAKPPRTSDAFSYIVRSRDSSPRGDGYYNAKHFAELASLERRTASLSKKSAREHLS